MASESFPVIIRCKDTTVALPIKTLIEESTIFKTLYESVENNSSSLSDSGRDSGCSLQDIQDLPYDEVKAVIENPNVDNSIDSSKVDVAETGDNNKINKNNEILEKTNKAQQNLRISQQVDFIDLSNFNGKSVRILFNSLLGHPELIDACNSLTDLHGVLKLCDEYGIASPIPQITKRFKTCDSITMTNLLDAMKIAEDIEKMKNYTDISANLIERCVSFARWNFASWQIVMKLIMEKKDQFPLVVKILKKLRDESEATIRFKVDNFSTFSESKISSTFIIRNLGWNILIYPINKENIGVRIKCENPNLEDDWLCDAKVTVGVVNQKTQQVSFLKEINHRFKVGDIEAEISEFTTFESVLDHSAGFIKDNQIVLEGKISVDWVKGVSDSLDISEEEYGWFSMEDNNKIKTISQDVKLDETGDAPVIFSCEKSFVTVNKLNLIKESSVFQAMFKEQWIKLDELSYNDKKENNIKQIKLTGYKMLSVKYLMEFVQGYPTLLNECKDMLIIGDMLKLSDFYDMKRPVQVLLSKISNLPIEMSNVTKAYEVSEALQDIAAFKDLSKNLSSKCIHYLRYNLGSWQVVINFLVTNAFKSDLVIKMIEMVAEEEVANIRFKTGKIHENMKLSVSTQTFIHKNTLWYLRIEFELNDDDKEEYIAIYLYKKNSEELKDPISCNAEYKLKIHKRPYWEAANEWKCKISEHHFTGNTLGWGKPKCMLKTEFLNPTNGYRKYGYSYFEFEMKAGEPTGIPESLGVTEDMII